MQNRISDFQFLRSSLRFAIGRTARSIALAIIRVLRSLAPELVRELALEALRPRPAERPIDRSVDDLLAYAVATETRLRFFRSDVIVFAGASCALARVDELRAARLALADRIEDLFGVDVPGSTSDVAEREARANARTERPTEFESDRDWSPPADVVLAPWELEAESIPPARSSQSSRAPLASHSPRLSRLSEVGAPPPCAHAGPADRSAASRVSGCAPDRSLASVPATDATDLPQLQTSCGRGVSQKANRPEGAEVEPHASAQPH